MDDELIETLVRAFPMVPRPIIVALIADAASWLELTDVQITMAAVRPLVVEALEFRLHGQRALC